MNIGLAKLCAFVETNAFQSTHMLQIDLCEIHLKSLLTLYHRPTSIEYNT